jgi:hypothetical protein
LSVRRPKGKTSGGEEEEEKYDDEICSCELQTERNVDSSLRNKVRYTITVTQNTS